MLKNLSVFVLIFNLCGCTSSIVSGSPGKDGLNGATGVTGQIGLTGEAGATGASGVAGDVGQTGASGIQGVTGNTGNAGLNGQIGATGATGSVGITGSSGTNGHSIVFQTTSADVFECSTGGTILAMGVDINDNGFLDGGDASVQTTVICNGLVGATGQTGASGAIGATGNTGNTGATGEMGNTGMTGSTGNQGTTGPSGTDGMNGSSSPFNPVDYITPCGPNSSSWKEVLLAMFDGDILASFSETQAGYNTRLALMNDGSYMDTDSSMCNFTVATDGNHNRLVSWSGGYALYTYLTKTWLMSY